MALSASSVLHYFDARYGSIPVIGGAPTFSRSSAGSWVDQTGTQQSAIVNTPRTQWAKLYGEDPSSPATLGKRRPVLTLERAATNLLLYSNDFSNAAWTKTTTTVTTGIDDPSGGTTACTLTATGANATTDQNLSAGSSLVRSSAVWLRRRTGTGTVKFLLPDGLSYSDITASLTTSWQRFTVTGSASTVRHAQIFIATNGDAVDAWQYQVEDGVSPSAGITTTSATVTRAADSLVYGYTPAPQAAMIYTRHVERGTVGMASAGLYAIGNAAGANPRLQVYPSGGFYRVFHEESGGGVLETLAVAPAYGDTVEIVTILFSDGSVQLIQSINGAAVTSTAQSAAQALSGAWSAAQLWLNSAAGNTGSADVAAVKMVKYADVVGATAQARMDELRSFALDSRQGVL